MRRWRAVYTQACDSPFGKDVSSFLPLVPVIRIFHGYDGALRAAEVEEVILMAKRGVDGV